MMRRKAILILAFTAIVAGLWEMTPRVARAEALVDAQGSNSHMRQKLAASTTRGPDNSPTSNSLMAQLFYPSPSQQKAIMVVGQGRVSALADTGQVVFAFGSEESSFPEGETPPKPMQKAVPITKELLRPVIDALVAIGLPASAIQVNINPVQSSPSPFSQGSAQVTVKLNKPTRDRVQQIVTAASAATSKNNKFFLQSVDVQYAVNDCPALERKAYLAAMNDAQSRAKALATAMNVQVKGTPSVAEEPISRLISSCNSEVDLSSFPFGSFTSSYDPSAPAEVSVWRNVFVTYTIE